MIELDNVTTGPTLALDDAKSMNTDTDLTKQCDEIVDRLLTEDLEYIEDDIETPGKDEQEFEEDIATLDTTPLELEELSDVHEELTQLPASPDLKSPSILALPKIVTEEAQPARRFFFNRRPSDEKYTISLHAQLRFDWA